jgi:glycosyltransferase involved in cell wall biosynthesis
MKRVQLVIPKWSSGMPWVEQFARAFSDCKFTVATKPLDEQDLFIFGWGNEDTVHAINTMAKKAPYIVYFRRYEIFSPAWRQLDWRKVDHVIFVNDRFRQLIMGNVNVPVSYQTIYNGVTMNHWSLKKRTGSRAIAMVGYINQKKNFPLAMQIILALPESYSLHIAGEVQCGETYLYINELARRAKTVRKIYFHGHIPHRALNAWLDDKDYILSTAISEGNPNNVLEAMAKGLKPIIHSWPGAELQFPGWTFNTVAEAVQMIKESCHPNVYRAWIEQHFDSVRSIERVREIAMEKMAVGHA